MWRSWTSSILALRGPAPLLPPEVRLDDPRVLLDFGGLALGDLLAVVQHGHLVRHFHDDPHVVLDQEDRETVPGAAGAEQGLQPQPQPAAQAARAAPPQEQRRRR